MSKQASPCSLPSAADQEACFLTFYRPARVGVAYCVKYCRSPQLPQACPAVMMVPTGPCSDGYCNNAAGQGKSSSCNSPGRDAWGPVGGGRSLQVPCSPGRPRRSQQRRYERLQAWWQPPCQTAGLERTGVHCSPETCDRKHCNQQHRGRRGQGSLVGHLSATH